MICLLIASFTACISSHLFVVVLVNVLVVNVFSLDGVVGPTELVETVEPLVPLCLGVRVTLVEPVGLVPPVETVCAMPGGVVVIGVSGVVPKMFSNVK